MNSLNSFIHKEIQHILRDRRTLLILFGLPIIQLILFGYAIRSELRQVPIAIVQSPPSVELSALGQKLEASGYFWVVSYFETETEIWEAFENGSIKAAVVVEPDYPIPLLSGKPASIQIISDGSDPNVAQTISSQLSGILRNHHTNPQSSSMMIQTEVRLLFNPEMKSVYLFVPGLMAFILMLVSALMTSISVAREKEQGTMEVLLVSPLRTGQIIIGKVAAYVALAAFNAITVSVLAVLVFDVPFRGSVILFSLLTLVYIITALALGVLISTRSQFQQTAMMISLGALLLPVILLSGFIFPIKSMPTLLQWISDIVPAKWYLIAARSIMLKGAGLEVVAKPLLILTGMMIFFLIAASKNLKDHLEL